jgi:eukaryotic-like serine/threonine-protein kinase
MIGKTLGHYRVGEQLGRGGMGEVYIADDLNLNRKVALKFLPDAFAADPERMARFEREAKLLASLNHTNIAAIYGLEQTEGKRFLVLELVEGETLAQRISKGPMPVEEALGICRQIAEGLEAAHEKGVVHRDLKPANVMITEGDKVKILDFGLAKALSDETQSVDSSHSPTLTEAMTRPCVILGTAAYMSPEQAKGKSVDKRADIWAFGCILYECLTARRTFEGETVTETLAAVLTREPEWEKVPAKVRSLLRRCMEKDPKKRLRDIGDTYALLEVAAETLPDASRKYRVPIWISIALLVGLGLGIAISSYFLSAPGNPPVMRLSILPPEKSSFGFTVNPSISPDGRFLAFASKNAEGAWMLFVRPLDSQVARPLTEINEASSICWSPDSRQLAFDHRGKLRKVELSGGRTESLCDLDWLAGGSWSSDGQILFASGINGPILRVSDSGGTPQAVTALEGKLNEMGHAWPQFLSDNRHFIYLGLSGSAENWKAKMGSLDSTESVVILNSSKKVAYASPGYLLFVRESALMAQPFRFQSNELYGNPSRIADDVSMDAYSGLARFSVSNSGVLAHLALSRTPDQLMWYDRQGNLLGSASPPGIYTNPVVSPDGKRVAADRYESPDAQPDVWIYDQTRQGNPSRFTFYVGDDSNSLWSPDGKLLAYSSLRESARDLYLKSIPGTGKEELLFKSPDDKYVTSWSPDGKTIMFLSRTSANKPYDLWTLTISGNRGPVPYSKTEYNELDGQFSPDGRWVAYECDKTGQNEIYVQSYPPSGSESKISGSGGIQPKWRSDGKEIYYLSPDFKMMAVTIKTSPSLEAGVPVVLFDPHLGGYRTRNNYDVTGDGQRFLIKSPALDNAVTSIAVTLNWTSLLKK